MARHRPTPPAVHAGEALDCTPIPAHPRRLADSKPPRALALLPRAPASAHIPQHPLTHPLNPTTTVDLSETITPKSDQLNADDLIAGPLDITITDVTKGSREQPAIIHYEGEAGRPYRPCKSMRRVLVGMWGKDGKAYVGKTLRLFRDDSVKFGGDIVGGIRISHASHIDAPFPILLTTTRAKRTQYTVQPLPRPSAQPFTTAPVGDDRLQYLHEQGQECAAIGTEALREFWRKLNAAERAALTPELEKWKQCAAQADAAAEIPDFPDPPLSPAQSQPTETTNELPL